MGTNIPVSDQKSLLANQTASQAIASQGGKPSHLRTMGPYKAMVLT